MKKTHEEYLTRAIELSLNAVKHGNLPFGAILVDGKGNIILEQENTAITEKNETNHAETLLARKAAGMYDANFLWNCTLYSSAEPCCMCTGTCYWANIGTIVYAISETSLLKLTGANDLNPTLDIPSRDIIKKGQKDIKIIGPFPSLEKMATKAHEGIWN